MIVLFDVNGTLLDPRAITGSEDGLGILDLTVMQSMVDTMTGQARPFPDYMRAALQIAGADVERGLKAAAALPPYPDARGALEALRAAGHTPVALTNSAADAARSALEAGGLLEHLETVIGADAVGAYKPDPRVYEHALAELDAIAGDSWMVAGHWWDVAGAKRAGLRTAWIARDEGELLSTTPEPDVRAGDLADAAGRIAAAARP
ncbi:MAG: HAD-IA family hydrolase [Solirubrobacteraceae bacterium]